jgi:predicted nucleic acid-binding Zn ribbon protein
VIFKGSGFHSTDYRKPVPAKDGESLAKPAGESGQATKDSAPKKTDSEPTKGSAAEGKSS